MEDITWRHKYAPEVYSLKISKYVFDHLDQDEIALAIKNTYPKLSLSECVGLSQAPNWETYKEELRSLLEHHG